MQDDEAWKVHEVNMRLNAGELSKSGLDEAKTLLGTVLRVLPRWWFQSMNALQVTLAKANKQSLLLIRRTQGKTNPSTHQNLVLRIPDNGGSLDAFLAN